MVIFLLGSYVQAWRLYEKDDSMSSSIKDPPENTVAFSANLISLIICCKKNSEKSHDSDVDYLSLPSYACWKCHIGGD